MNNERRPGLRSTDPGGNRDSRALDRFEDEGGPGPEDTRDQRRDAPPSAPTEAPEVADPGRVVVTTGVVPHAFQIHHRDIPELHADGASPGEAAANLAQDLAREVEGIADNHRSGLFRRALADVRASVEQRP